VLLESAAPHTLVALAGMDYGIGVVPSNVALPASVRALPVVQRGASIGRWLTVAWDPRRMLAGYAEQFVDELAAHWRRDYPAAISFAVRRRCPGRRIRPPRTSAPI
jgi:hypothetical protein